MYYLSDKHFEIFFYLYQIMYCSAIVVITHVLVIFQHQCQLIIHADIFS
jgi:hypothetical protein